jgi:glycosyltransferase involved in cell wall biosynthesis
MTSKKIQVIFCTDGIFPHAVGGMQRHSRLLVEKLATHPQLELTVIHPHQDIKVFNNPSIKEIVAAPVKKSNRYLINCWNYSKAISLILAENPGAVIYSQGLSVWHQINKVGNRVIVNPHGLEPYQTLSLRDYMIGAPFRIIFNNIFRKAHRVVSLGGRLTGILLKYVPKKNLVVLPNAVNIPAAPARSFEHQDKKLKFLFVGRFALNKGINILAEAVKELNAEGYADKFEFNLVGKGPLFDQYVKQYAFPNLHFLGFADDDKLNALYKENDVFVLPTLFEGMPTVVLEAMAYGMPVIVTDVGATLEMVDGTNGFIIEKNSVASLKQAILKYSKLDPSSKKQFSEASYNKVKNNFTWEIVARMHAGLFEQVASEIR